MFATSNYQKMDCCRKIKGNKIFDISELFRCYFDLFMMFFRCFYSMFCLSISCLFYIFVFRYFVVLCFVIDPLHRLQTLDLLCLVLQCLPKTYHMYDHHCHIEALPVTIIKVKKDYGTSL